MVQQTDAVVFIVPTNHGFFCLFTVHFQGIFYRQVTFAAAELQDSKRNVWTGNRQDQVFRIVVLHVHTNVFSNGVLGSLSFRWSIPQWGAGPHLDFYP